MLYDIHFRRFDGTEDVYTVYGSKQVGYRVTAMLDFGHEILHIIPSEG